MYAFVDFLKIPILYVATVAVRNQHNNVAVKFK